MYIPVLTELLGLTSVTQLLLFTTLVLAVVYYLYATRHHGVWEKLGVPGPKPWPIIDHRLELRNGESAAVKKWFEKYGNTFGVYGIQPLKPGLFTKDLNLVKQVLVKDFDNFVDRSRPRTTETSFKNGLTSVNGDKWRRTRHVTSPFFTGSRLKLIFKHICDSAETATKIAKEKSSKGLLLQLKDFSSKYATEVIARVGFGVVSHPVSEEETEFGHYARNMVIVDSKFLDAVGYVYNYFPPIDKILKFFRISTDFVSEKADEYFVSILNSTIKERKQKQNESRTKDLLDMLIHAEVENNDPRLKDTLSRTLSHDEIIGNSTMLLLAGVETVSTTFQSILYCLALYPEIQDKLVAEIDRIFPKGTNIDYDQLKELKYAEQVIHESLRLFPLIGTILRIAAETKTYGHITIPKGTYVNIPISEIMKDPEHWPDPEKFDPERFAPENKGNRDALAFMPFGYGPRICLGQRLAMLELKTILVYLLREMNFSLSDRTMPKKGDQLVVKLVGNIALRPAKPIQLEVVPRK